MGEKQMKKIITLITAIICLSNICLASSIKKITLDDLYLKADLIVIARVIHVDTRDNQDHVTINAVKCLKGTCGENIFSFNLVASGGLKDFDPALRVGDTGVFFLKKSKIKPYIRKAYWGSVATFTKNHFYLSQQQSGSYDSMLTAWRSYRLSREDINHIEAYEKGFHKGFHGVSGFVDRSHDYNLGHSDGMLAKMNKLPIK